MSVVYFDSSALLSLVRDEPGSALLSALWNRADALIASRLADAEVRAVLRAGERTGRLSAAAAEHARTTWQTMWPALRKVEVTAAIADHGAALAEEHGLRAGDGLQLASVLLLAEAEPVVAVTDARLAEAATGQGLRVLP
ncbi:MAG TPA: type II toxin-antitoxin system VapC family toxin [Beutenbergiaceae bacterium]|nr:type II toxin-antitoxin system VapC family toxin [Beutenbergiaceae bacterium]